jgi:hypothetical protein
MDDKTEKYYKDLTVKKSPNFDKLMKSLDIAQRFIKHNKLILVGGQSIDYALRVKNHPGIYTDDAIPDLDIVTHRHYQNAYNLAIQLHKAGITGISVINAFHPSTMKVRVDFQDVMDITYIPKHVEECIPTLWYRGYHIIHPHYQYIDQHRSLSYPYENAPYETILNRPAKDIKRYELLYEYYPMRILYTSGTSVNLQTTSVPKRVFFDQCISGFVALSYWIKEAKNLGFQTDINFGKCDFKSIINTKDQDSNISIQIPNDVNGITLYSDDMESLYTKLMGTGLQSPYVTETKNKIFFARFLDKLPRKVIIDNQYELIDNNQRIAAHSISDRVHVANIQAIMMYILINYIILTRMSNSKKSYAYYAGYVVCRDILKWASNEYKLSETEGDESRLKQIMKFLPTSEYYGSRNQNDAYTVSDYKFRQKSDTSKTDESNPYTQPKHVYDKDLVNKDRMPKYFDFDVGKSDVFDIGGNIVSSFYKSISK